MSDFPNCSFFAQKKSNRSFSKCANGQPWLQGWAIAHSLIRSLLISAPFKRAIEQSLAHLLF